MEPVTPTALDVLALLGMALGVLFMLAGAAGQQLHHNRSRSTDG